MNTYKIEYWYRHGRFEKDFDIIDVEADSEAEAIQIVRDLQKWVYSVKIINENTKQCQN